DLQPVFEAILRSAQRLLGARTISVFRRLGDAVHLAAFTSAGEAGDAAYKSLFPMSLDDYRERFPFAMRDWVTGTVTHIPDVELDTRSPDIARRLGRARGFRSVLQVPMRREGQVIGVLGITRTEPGAFAADEIALAQTFADQAVIAIENVRLFKELEARNNELRSSLEQQTATSELLKVIGRSTFDLQPVFDALAENAVRFCEAERAFIFRVDGQLLRGVASYNASPEIIAFIERNPATPGRGSATGRAALERRTVHIHDALADPEYTYGSRDVDRFRTIVGIPMLKAGELLGVITIYRHDVRPFSDSQIALMETFADQAAIAIENVRLFNETKEALDQQTATSEILRVIASSPTDVQPVFDAIAQ